MKMAKASDNDLEMGMDLCRVLDSFESSCFPEESQRHDDESFDIDSGEDCKRAMEHIFEVYGRGSLMRVVFGMATVLNPANEVVDPDADTLERHPNITKLIAQRDELLAALISAKSEIEGAWKSEGITCGEDSDVMREIDKAIANVKAEPVFVSKPESKG